MKELEETRAKQNFNQQDSERFLVGMMRTNFLKRLESSSHALTLTLDRTICKIDILLDKIDRYEKDKGSANDFMDIEALPEEDEEDEEFSLGGSRQPYRLRELDVVRWKDDLRQDKETLAVVRQQVVAITPERDGKLREIRQAIRNKVEHHTTDRCGKPNRKMLVFTTFKDTAEYLYDNLTDLAAELHMKMAMVSGDDTRTTAGANNFNAILTNFAPVARNRGTVNDGVDIDLLIATDCISEGQNLQDCDTVLNYDIHWNPVRLIQRFGRIDRIGSRSNSVRMVNYWPTSDMDVYLKLENRVQARMALADVAASGDDDLFTETDAQLELKFRDEQLQRLREQILVMDDLDDGPTMGDFTLDYFITQLLRYLQRNRDALEAMPPGVYAVTELAADAQPGVIFVLRQRNASIDRRQRLASPVHPYYFAYIHRDGTIRFGCGNTQQVLEVFETVARDNTSAITELCDGFDQETDYGRNMLLYNKLLNDVIAHIRQAHASTQSAQLRPGGARDFILPTAAETPDDAGDFELVTWLVIKEAQ